MKLEGFIGPAYQLDSVNVDAQRCVNLYPEVIESGRGKEAQVAYLRATPGLEEIAEVGNGPIRCVHVDSIGRVFVVSGNQIYALSKKADWRYRFDADPPAARVVASTGVNTTDDEFDAGAIHGFATGLRVRVTTSNTLPSPLTVDTDYYIIDAGLTGFYLATSFANALAGTKINITAAGTGNHTFTPQEYDPLLSVKHTDIDFTRNAFVKADHGYPDGLAVTFKATGQYPSALTEGTTYYITNRLDDSFQLASSYANGLAGTEVDLSDVADAWNTKLLGEDGEYGGAAVTLAASEGPVKAASMSFGGDGTDSSTIFVDGSNNYLLKDDEGAQTLGVLGEIDVAQAIFNINTDITVHVTENVSEVVGSSTMIIATTSGAVATHKVLFFKLTEDATGIETFRVSVILGTGGAMTTAEMVEYLNTGVAPSGMTIVHNDFSGTAFPPPGYTLTPLPVGSLAFSGGDSQDILVAFSPSGTTEGFTLQTLSGEGFGSVPTATQIVWSDGYFILNQAGTNKFWVSDLQGFNVNALSFASSEGSPDILLALAVSNRYLYALNEKTTEVYANTGNADFPFERISGGFIEVGLAAEHSVANAEGTICWLGRTARGEGVVYAAEGLSPRRISTHAIEQAIHGYADISTAKAYSYQERGHIFYVLNFDEATWVYDFSTGLWHERAYSIEGTFERHRAESYAYDLKRKIHLVADYETNQVYQLKEGHFTDNGAAITRLRASPHTSGGLNFVFYHRFQLDMETGIGLDGGAQGSNPTVMLDWSNDGGHTWSDESWALADVGSGQIGDFSKRVVWRRLGKARDRIWRVKITDPVKIVLLGAYIEATGGSS